MMLAQGLLHPDGDTHVNVALSLVLSADRLECLLAAGPVGPAATLLAKQKPCQPYSSTLVPGPVQSLGKSPHAG